MARPSEQLEHEAEVARIRFGGALDELRFRLTPGNVVDQVTDYARQGPAAEFLRNLSRDIQENPMPLLLIALGVAWAIIDSSRRTQQNGALEPAPEFAATSVTDAVASSPGQRQPVLVPAD